MSPRQIESYRSSTKERMSLCFVMNELTNKLCPAKNCKLQAKTATFYLL